MSARFSFPLLALCFFPLGSSAMARDGETALPDDWLKTVSRVIEREEYAFSQRPDGAWSSPNRSQDFRIRVTAEETQVFPRATDWTGRGAAWTVRLQTTAFGRTSDFVSLPTAVVNVDGNRASRTWPNLEEWLVNDNKGLEQGWTIHQRPAGIGDDALWIGLSFEGDLVARLDSGSSSARLESAEGKTVLRYTGLLAWDANGEIVPAFLTSAPKGSAGIGIRVVDTHATYPITVDPILTGPEWTSESDQDSARFGFSVATAGDVNGDGYSDQLIGAIWFDDGENNEGRVFLYPGSASGPVTTATWTADGNAVFAELGWSVSTAGDVNGDGYSDVVVGAPNFANGETDEGAAYVYLGSSTGLALTPVWSFESNQIGAKLGSAVGTAGDVDGDGFSDIVVGAPLFDDAFTDEGRAFVFLGSGTGPSLTADWMTEGGVASAQFGFSVFTAGDVDADGFDDLAVGADRFANGEVDEGAAFLFSGSGTGLGLTSSWSFEADLAGAEFGSAVRTAGDVNGDGFADLAVGAPGYTNGQAGEGRSFVFYGSGTGPSLVADWTFETNGAGARFGTSIGTAGDLNGDGYGDLIVGAPNFAAGEADEGAIVGFLGSPSGLATGPFFSAQSNQVGGLMGFSVSTAGDTNGDGYADIITGSPDFDAGETDEGRAFLYLGSAEDQVEETFNVQSNQIDAHMGEAVAGAGDVNGDGYSDVLIGAPDFDNGETDEGSAFLFLGSATGLGASAAWTAESDQAGAFFGDSLGGAGDVNGDGYGDVIVGAPAYTGANALEGRAYLYLGSSGGLALTAAWTVEGGQAGASFGDAVDHAGDVNGDGFGDVIVGAPDFDDQGGTDEGEAYVYAGSSTGLGATPLWTATGSVMTGRLGASVSSAGDVNGDGFSDVAVGSPQFANGETAEGGVFVYHGSASGPSLAFDWSAESDQAFASFGFSIDSAGDVNGDGFSDLVVGARTYDNTFANEGRAYAYLGSGAGLAATAVWTGNGAQISALFGNSVAGAGDINGDGYGDILIGAPLRDVGQVDEGQAFLFIGSASGPGTLPAWNHQGNQTGGQFAFSVAGAGDVDGDGYADVVAGTPAFMLGQADEGGAVVFSGNDGLGGWIQAPLQVQTSGSTPIALLGASETADTYRLTVSLAKGLAGVSWASPGPITARLEWEEKPIDTPFDGTGLVQGAIGMTVATGSLPIAFDEGVLRSSSSTLPDHWRARIVTDNPLFPSTPWFSLPGNSMTEAKLRFAEDDGGPPDFYILLKPSITVP